MSEHERKLYSEVRELLKLFLVCTVPSVTSECSFSTLRRIKTWLQEQYWYERLNSAIVYCCSQASVGNTGLKPLVQEVISRNDLRRIHLEKFDKDIKINLFHLEVEAGTSLSPSYDYLTKTPSIGLPAEVNSLSQRNIQVLCIIPSNMQPL